MVRSLWTGASGMIGQQFNIDTISHNLSNVNTTGYKKTRADFEDLLYQNIRMAGTPSTSISNYPTGIHVGLGVKPEQHKKYLNRGHCRIQVINLILQSKVKAFLKYKCMTEVKLIQGMEHGKSTAMVKL